MITDSDLLNVELSVHPVTIFVLDSINAVFWQVSAKRPHVFGHERWS